ncbi:ribonuclease H-like domain-containing protein [Tanacetum coccineum]|uniref:Ribonuclease H-like domain-containing protein n=1 Tax=Tanacetum coccineum TaxID=301880 RepID=A0ABQ5FDJ1_9ASTR
MALLLFTQVVLLAPLNEDDGGHSYGVDASASEGERSANLEDNIISSEGYNLHIHPQDRLIDFKVKYGLGKYVNYSNLSKGNYCFAILLNKGIESKTFIEASQHKHWVDTMNAEMDAFYRKNTWELVNLPAGRKFIGSKWVFKIKYKSGGEIERYKARLVAKSYNQGKGIDFDETFSPVVKIVPVRCLINLAVQFGWTLYQIDINNAFLYGDLNETVYMTLSHGYFPSNETRVDFVQSKSDYSLFTKSFGDVFIALLVYVDDIIITRNEPKDDDPLLENVTDYQNLIGKPIYLTTTRPDIAYTVSCLSHFMHSPLKSYLKTVLKHTQMQTGQDVLILEEAKYRALASVTSEVVWILKMFKDLNYNKLLPVKVFCDNNSAINIAADPIFHEITKHLEIDLHFVRENIIARIIQTVKIKTTNQIADILSKELDTKQHDLLCSKLNLIDLFQNKIKGEF